jgi:ligand-binding sensor domain-containing protein
MKTTLNAILFLVSVTIFTSCSGQTQKPVENTAQPTGNTLAGDTVTAIGGQIRCIFQDSKKNIWFATNGEGVFKYNGKTTVQFTTKHGLCSNYVWMIEEGKDGNTWFKTNVRPKDVDAICYFNGHEFTTVRPDTNRMNYNFQNGELLFDYYYDGKTLSKIQLPQNSPIKNEENKRRHYDIYSTLKDSKGNSWFGTATAGICKYDGKTYTWFDNKELGAAVRSIFEDRNGTIWIGNNGEGLFRYSARPSAPAGTGGNDTARLAQPFTNITREKKLDDVHYKENKGCQGPLTSVWAITDDKEGNLWIATLGEGVWKYDGKTFTNYRTKDGLGINFIWTIYRDRNDTLWFGTDGAGVYTFNGKRFEKPKL